MINKWIPVILTAFIIFSGCTSFDIGFVVKPAQPPSQKKPQTSPPPQKDEPVETAPSKETVEKQAPTPAQTESSATPQEKTEESVPAQEQPVKQEPSQKQPEEPAPAQDVVKVITQEEEKVVKTPPEETPSSKVVAKVTPSEEKSKEELPGESKPSTKGKEEKEAIATEITDEKTTTPQKGPDTLIIAGIVTVEKNEYFILDPSSKVRYRIIGLKKEERDALQKQIGKMVKVEIKVLETQSAKSYNTQLIRFL